MSFRPRLFVNSFGKVTVECDDVETWEDLLVTVREWSTHVDSWSVEGKYKLNEIWNDLCKKSIRKGFTDELREVPNELNNQFWSYEFNASHLNDDTPENEVVMPNVTKQNYLMVLIMFVMKFFQKEEKEKKKRRIKYLELLTDHVLGSEGNEMQIDSNFIGKLFEHKLNKCLMNILRSPGLYNVTIDLGDLENLYVRMACDTENTDMFYKLIPYLNKEHLRYAVDNASLDFLMWIWKSRRRIPNLAIYMKEFNEEIILKDWRQQQFFDWWFQST